MSQTEIKHLLEKYRIGQCTEKEQALLDSWYLQQLDKPANISLDEIRNAETQIRSEVFKHIKSSQQRNSRKLWAAGIAASLLVVMGLALGQYFFNKEQKDTKGSEIAYLNDVAPGKNQAVLQLANGRTIELSDTKTGVVFNGASATYDDGSALNTSSSIGRNNQIVSATTPKGGTYRIVLSDGTKVWLNAASSLKFPQSFENTSVRRVELKGEGYFEVAKVTGNGQKRKPFIVVTDKQEVEVLGTHFNVSSYDDDTDTKTTLLEGAVKVTAINHQKSLNNEIVLKPGNLSVLKGSKFTVSEVDTEEAVAWKNGEFLFKNEELSSIMRKISRWYDVEVIYEGEFANMQFGGGVSRFKNISEVLRKFELTGKIHFKIEGRRIIVMP
ncbi:FecR family protein [Pedobacter frigoris]|uniref:FecR family protein n=1 Tax=Pedobacter frigoris TaxID=2571272 RepID=UPI00292CD113|nr:FecR domain-containing protein [Pedobacter frigoris]